MFVDLELRRIWTWKTYKSTGFSEDVIRSASCHCRVIVMVRAEERVLAHTDSS